MVGVDPDDFDRGVGAATIDDPRTIVSDVKVSLKSSYVVSYGCHVSTLGLGRPKHEVELQTYELPLLMR